MANENCCYAGDWRHFMAWCRQVGLSPLPATPATLAAYLAAQAEVTPKHPLSTAALSCRSSK